MSSKVGDLYQNAFAMYRKCFSKIPVAIAQKDFNTLWKLEVNDTQSKEVRTENAEKFEKFWKEKAFKLKSQNILSFLEVN